jgi:DNA-binding FrmR family transcriptional regulator
MTILGAEKPKILTGFKKARSLLSKIIEMAEKNEYCVKIMQQNLAAIGLLRSAHESLMKNHLHTCFKAVMATKDEKKKRAMIKEVLMVSKLFNR